MKRTVCMRVLSLFLTVLLCLSLLNVSGGLGKPVHAATQNQKNMVARADYFYGITWVAQQTVAGWGGTFYKGNTYRIPYGQPIYSGKYIGYQATFDEFTKAAATAGSIFYTGRSWYEGTTAPYYVSDCSAFVSWCWGIDRTTTYYIPGVSTNLGYVTVSRATSTLQLGDALNSSSHVVMVTDLAYGANGAITSIEITEQTPPQMKRTLHTPSSLYQKYSQYTIQRYQGNVPVAPKQAQETWIEKACFDPTVYRTRYKDLANMTDAQLKAHWLNHGIKEGRASSAILDLGYYLNNNPDLKKAYGNDYTKLYNHFITLGYKEHRKSSPLFDGQYYTDNHKDVAEKYKELYLKHYVDNGMREGRRASLTFDPDYYWFIRPDVAKTWPGDYEMCIKHYAGHGIAEKIVGYDNQMPVISDAVISDVTADGYTVTCKVTDNWGVSKVAFPSWTLANDQDDLAEDFMNTQMGTQNGSTYTFRVNASAHNNEGGQYVTHIYAVDKGGNQTKLALEAVEVKDPEPEKIRLNDSADYAREGDLITNVKADTTVTELLTQFENQSLEVLDGSGEPLDDTALVCTGTILNLYSAGVQVDTVILVVRGDVDGNGKVNTTDYIRVKAAFLGNLTFSEVETVAADVDESHTIDVTDYMRIKAHLLDKFNLNE